MSYSEWIQSPFGYPGRLDGVSINELGIVPLSKEPAPSAALYQTADGGTGFQIQLSDVLGQAPGVVAAYRWPLTIQADSETSWYKLLAVSQRRRAVDWIDFEYQSDLWEAGPELSEFHLSRRPAEVAWDDFPTLEYPKLAVLNGVEQTVVSGSFPSAGEVAIEGRIVTVPTLAAGDLLEVRYVPAYLVVVSSIPRTLRGFHDWVQTPELREVLSLPVGG